MNPFFFGDSKAPLYGVFHQADQSSSKHGVLLCPPFGQEYMRSHRAIRQLAIMLSRIGIPVLRFDYRGTGDSAEKLEDVNASMWLEDVNTAIDELKDTARVDSVSLIGLRLGCLLATHAILERKDVERLVLWDPVISGQAYIDELKHSIKTLAHKKNSNFIARDGSINYNGFELHGTLQNSLCSLSLKDSYPLHVSSVLQVVSHNSDSFSNLESVWSVNNGFCSKKIDAAGDWNYVDGNGGILLPQPIIQGIVDEYKLSEAA